MNYKSVACAFVAGVLLQWVPLNHAIAQSNPAKISEKQVDGITVAVSGVHIQEKSAAIQFIITNNTSSRLYIRDAIAENSQKAFLGTGKTLTFPTLVGIEACSSSVSGCLQQPVDLNVCSSIEPGEFTAFGHTYSSDAPIADTDTISFTISLIAISAAPNKDASQQVGRARAIRFNFPYTSLSVR